MSSWLVAEGGRTAALAVAAAAALLAFLVVLELRRRRGRLGRRLAASALAVASLLLLFLRPGRRVEAGSASAVLLTPGESPDRIEAGSGELGFTLGPGLGGGSRWRPLPDLAFLARHHPEIHRLRVAGHGLPPWEWQAFGGAVEPVGETRLDAGVRQASWRRRIALGEDLVVRGVAEGTGTLGLEGPGGTEGSVDVDGEATFELRARPRDAGRFLYRWVFAAGDGELRRQGTVDVVVDQPAPVAVLWLEDAPGFETRHFKSWLTARQGKIAIRSRTSRDRYRDEFHNISGLDLSPLDPGLLERFDLVVIDDATLAALRPAEAATLRSAVEERGLGLLVRASPDAPERKLADAWPGFRVADVADLDEMSVSALWPGAEPTTPLDVAAREIVPGGGADPVVGDESGRWLVASRVAGVGEVGLSLLHGTYRWILEGHPEHHGRFWSRVIGALARRAEKRSRWVLPAGPIFVDEPIELGLQTGEPLPAATVAPEGGVETRLALSQDVLEPSRWHARWWPRQPGWHQLAGVEAAAWLWVEDAGGWSAWRQARRRSATRQRAVLGPSETETPEESPRRREELPRVWLYLTFLVSVGYLWGDERGWR